MKKRGGGGCYEAYSEQLVLTPTTDQRVPAQTGVEERGKHRVAMEESSNSNLLVVLKEMKEQMRERDKKMRGELRWIDNHLEDQIKKKENTIEAALQ